MITSLIFLGGFLTVMCAPGLIAQSLEERRAKSDEAA